MAELAKIMASETFKNSQKEFFAQHCEKFDQEEENKLEYTSIHKAYEDMVEAQIKTQLGDEKFKKIELGLA